MGVHPLLTATTEVQSSEFLWGKSKNSTVLKSQDCILYELGRMAKQIIPYRCILPALPSSLLQSVLSQGKNENAIRGCAYGFANICLYVVG